MISQTPWIERKFNFDFPIGLFPVIIERLRSTVTRIEEMIRDIPEEKLSLKKAGHWSPKEIIGHLCDLEELWDKRITDFLGKKHVLTAADMSNAKTHQAGHNNRDSSDLVSTFRTFRSSLINRVKDLSEKEAGLTALHPRLKSPMRLVDSLFFVAEHDDHELTKLRTLLATS